MQLGFSIMILNHKIFLCFGTLHKEELSLKFLTLVINLYILIFYIELINELYILLYIIIINIV